MFQSTDKNYMVIICYFSMGKTQLVPMSQSTQNGFTKGQSKSYTIQKPASNILGDQYG